MTPAQRQRIKDLFDAAFELAPPEQARWLAESCQDDPAVRAETEKLLRLQAAAPALAAQSAAELLGLPVTPAVAESMTGRQIGPYRLLRELGQGGMGRVYLAERVDGVHSQQVALKLVWPGFGSEAVLRFQQERELLARLVHPHIARLHDGGATEEGWHYLVMEYVEGPPLTAYCRKNKLSIPARLALFRTVCEAVQYAHQNLIVHRDLKPANLLVTQGGTPKLLDFGIAKLLERGPNGNAPSTLTRSGQQPFTPLYASPEQIRNEPITTASDVYSLGVLLYELLTGVKPYRTESDADILRAVCEEEPERPSVRVATQPELLPQFSETALARWQQRLRGDLDNIVLKALQKEVRLRYATVEQLSDDLQRHLNGEPVTARPATLRSGKYARRNKTFVIAASVLLLALIGGAGVTAWQLRASRTREREQRRELYAADMRQAGADWGEGNLVHMDELLERHRPGNATDNEWRGFEWFALWKLLHTEKFILPHQAWVPTVRYTPDGKLILTGSRDGRIEMWDATSGQSLGLFAIYPEGVYNLAISDDGRKLAATGYEGLVSIWDFASRRVIVERPNVTHYQSYLTFSPDGKWLAIKINYQALEVWDTESGQLTETHKLPSDLNISRDGPPIYSPDGRLLCLAQVMRHWELWDVVARHSIARLDPQSSNPSALMPFYPTGHIFSRDGRRLYLPTRDFLMRVWDAQSGKLLHVFRGHQDNIETPAVSYDDKLLASGSDDRTLRLWDTQTGKLLATVRNESQTFSPVFSPDNKYLAAVCMRALRVKVWDVQRLLSEPNSFNQSVMETLSPDGKTMLTDGFENESPALRDVQTGQQIISYQAIKSFGSYSDNYSVKFSSDGKLFTNRNAPIPAKPASIVEVRATANGKLIASLTGHAGYIVATAFSPNGKTLATVAEDGIVKLWETANRQERASLRRETNIIFSVEFSPDSSKLLVCGKDNAVQVWDVASKKELLNLRGHRGWIPQAKYSPDGKLVASASWDYTVKLWDTTTGRELHTLKGHANSVYAIAFSPDGKRLASGGDDTTVRLWDVQTGAELTALRGHTGKVWRVAFTPDGQTLVSSSEKETRIWRTATEAEVRARR